MSKHNRTAEASKLWHTLKLDDKFMLIMSNTRHSNQAVKLRQDDGTLWEAFGFVERCETLYDDMHELDAADIEEIIKGSSMTCETFKDKCDPQKKCAFRLNGCERFNSTSEIFRKDMYAQIIDGACVPELVAMEKTTEDEMTADLFGKYKHVKRHTYDYNMTRYTSMRLTLVRVPEYCC